MMNLLIIKDKVKSFYAAHEMLVTAAIKFVLVLISMFVIKTSIGFMEQLHTIPVMLLLSLFATVLPYGLIIVILSAVIVANVYALSMQLAIVALSIIFVMFVLYFRFSPKDGVILLLVPMTFFLGIQNVIPLIVGLVATPVSIVAVAFGTVVYYMMSIIGSNAGIINNMESESSTAQIEYFIKMIIENKEMYACIGTALVVVVIVYVIRRKQINNAWITAVVVGGIISLVLSIASTVVLAIDKSLVFVCIGAIVSLFVAMGLQFFIFTVDYSRTEHTQFEDDDYYYYVKAVPKINITAPAINVKRINAQRRKKNIQKTEKKNKQ